MCNRGGHKREKCVHEYSVMCIFHQCRSVAEGVQGVYSLQLVKGLLLTVDSGKGRGVYSKVYSWSRGFKGVYSLQ